jgi:putative hydrolase of the HAD superfamily
MTNAVLFDLGGTLVHYFERHEFPAILEQAIAQVQTRLRREGLLRVSEEVMWRRVRDEDHEARDHRVRPLEGRLGRIFQVDAAVRSAVTVAAMCRCFMKPIFARGRCYADTLPTLRTLRSAGLRIAVVSNTPWGSPSALWREEMDRLGVREWVDVIVFCGDVGWRKPSRRIFESTLQRLNALPKDCLFVGDDSRWDLIGPRAMGIEAILIDRGGVTQEAGDEPIRQLHELVDRLQLAW